MHSKIDKSKYPVFALLVIFNWILYTNVPFLSWIKGQLFIEIILLIPMLKYINSVKKYIKQLTPVFCFMGASVLTSIFTGAITDHYMWESIVLMFLVILYTCNYTDQSKSLLVKGIYISTNIITLVSLLGILLVKYTRILKSPIYLIQYSLGNFIQGGRYYGMLSSCNTLGPLAAASCLIALYNITQNKSNIRKILSNTLIFLLNLDVLIGTKSITATASLIVAIVIYGLLFIKRHRNVIITALIILCICSSFIILTNTDSLPNGYHRDWKTASSRTIIWDSALQLLESHPFIGLGTRENYVKLAEENNLYIHKMGTHNMYIDVATRHGWITFSFFILMFIYPVFKAIIAYFKGFEFESNFLKLSLAFLGYTIIHSMFETKFFFYETPISVIFQLCCVVSIIYNYKKTGENKNDNN